MTERHPYSADFQVFHRLMQKRTLRSGDAWKEKSVIIGEANELYTSKAQDTREQLRDLMRRYVALCVEEEDRSNGLFLVFQRTCNVIED